MAHSVFRLAWCVCGSGKYASRQIGLLTARGANMNLSPLQVATITHKQFRDPSKKKKPYPYKEKSYNLFTAFLDSTVSRFDENTKVILIEGNIGVGKSSLGKKIAEELDMKYYPEATMEYKYIDDYGFDLRVLDPLLPEACRSFDIEKFYKNPNDRKVAIFQVDMYKMRFEMYVNALAHLLSTGQGVVLDRSPFSDIVFAETLQKFGYIRKIALDGYKEIVTNSITDLLRPHLVIYLDSPVDILLQKIKKRNIPYEVNSKVLTKEYLSSIDYYYKQVFLKDIGKHAELLIYDWTDFGDAEIVVEDIERIDFEKKLADPHDPKFADWRNKDSWEWNDERILVTSKKYDLLGNMEIPLFHVPELIISGEDWEQYYDVINKVPSQQYFKGYNKHFGESSFFKFKLNYRDRLKMFYLPD